MPTQTEPEASPGQTLETSLAGIWSTLSLLSTKQPSSMAAQQMLQFLQEKQLSVTDFIGIIVSKPSDEAVDLACKCVSVVCRVLGLENMEESGLIDDGLSHSDAQIQGLVLDLLVAPGTKPELRLQHLSNLLPLLASPSTAVSTPATSLLIQIATTNPTAFFSPSTVSELTDLLQTSTDTVKLRVIELIIRLASSNDATLTALDTNGLLSLAIEDPLESRDILTRLNGLQILTDLLTKETGIQVLERSGVLTRVSNFMKGNDALVQSAAIGFYARLASVQSGVLSALEDAYGFLGEVERLLVTEEGGLGVREACLVAVGNVGSSAEGLLMLGSQFQKALEELVETVNRGTGMVKVVAVQSFSCLLDGDGDVETCAGLFEKIGGCLGGVLPMIKSFDEELRVSGYAVLKGAVKHEWGLKKMKESGQLINYLLDRGTETTQQGMKWRFSVIESIALGPLSKEVLQEVIFHRFVKYAKEGPFYRESQPQVMMMSS
ncbi:26S proteasome non-ATPase regulatory subunit 5 [Podochytrium sp. JEL0797]|nr:26S proteasome non-ATPase regulatory subunit 5 [Podochytrium sp. JEL0797]